MTATPEPVPPAPSVEPPIPRRIEHYRKALEDIIRQPQETMSDGKAVGAMVRIAKAALKAKAPTPAPQPLGTTWLEFLRRFNDTYGRPPTAEEAWDAAMRCEFADSLGKGYSPQSEPKLNADGVTECCDRPLGGEHGRWCPTHGEGSAGVKHAANCATQLDKAWAGACDCGADGVEVPVYQPGGQIPPSSGEK